MLHELTHHLLALLPPATLVTRLKPFVSVARQQRIQSVLEQRRPGIHIVVEALSDPRNLAAILRSCDAFGVVHVHSIAIEGRAARAPKVTQGAASWLAVHDYPDLTAFLAYRNTHNLTLWGASLDGNLTLRDLPPNQPCGLWFGNEERGLSPAALAACDNTFRIPMCGMSQSLNISVAAGICLHHLKSWPHQGFDAKSYSEFEARYYLNSVNPRLIEGLWPEETRAAASNPLL